MISLGFVVHAVAFSALFVTSFSERREAVLAKDEEMFKLMAKDVYLFLKDPSASNELVRMSQDVLDEHFEELPELAEVPGCLNTVTKKRWINTNQQIGFGMAGSVWVVQDGAHDDKEYALKMMRVRPESEQRPARGGLIVTLQDFASEVAAQRLAAEKIGAPTVIDYWVCRRQTEEEPRLGFIVMDKIQGKSFKEYATQTAMEGNVWCQAKFLPPAPSVMGYIPQELHQQIQNGVEILDQDGLYIADFHAGNFIIENATNRLVFIDFGDVTGCEHKPGHAKVDAMTKLGCPIQTNLVELVQAQDTINVRDLVFMKGADDWWIPGNEIKERNHDSTFFTVKSRNGTKHKNVPVADLFRLENMECLHDQDYGSSGEMVFDMLDRLSEADHLNEGRDTFFSKHLADIRSTRLQTGS
mmetsp:Transcript_70377/g.139594  ORF Transcript_70377/g.139594 Transcript_70377/m.139594 type:complete len:413 (-) Transcript_70377:23-1261(-)